MSCGDIFTAMHSSERRVIGGAICMATIFQRIQMVARNHHGTMTVMFSMAVPEALVLKLLEMPWIASVVVATTPSFAFLDRPGQVGFLRPDGRVGRAPSVIGELVLTFGETEAFGFELTRLSLRKGGKRIVFDTPIGFTKSKSLWVLLAKRFYRGVNQVVSRKTRNFVLP